MRTQVRRTVLAAVAVAAIAAAWSSDVAIAHHGWSGYHNEEFELTGTVETPVGLNNPHGTMRIRAEGQVWNIVLSPPARTKQAGLEQQTIPVGTKVTVQGHRHRDPKTLEVKTERVIVDGKVYNVYPDRD
jgi:hypothetical protein